MTDNMQARIHAAGYADHTPPCNDERRTRPIVPGWMAIIPFLGAMFAVAVGLVAWGLR